ncbi:SRPBCC domain-containing protein [Actinomadura sp. DC4]|uniref:SRPBCC domain-containing protein n=1 Tax=Actinomadura sp. DC4 TaxID=3055069 RepID=UPI0025B185FC|nr:SRPBCC domain-containing protein [Actinomadura sp. DC4]MDN3351509.1 SRPBCC domain-containing protein [Actinomadura sp. DC4]
MGTPDRIEREISIDAPLDRVWGLVSEPGWWVGEGEDSGRQRRREGGLDVIDSRWGSFPVRVETVEPQTYVAYRWSSTAPGEVPSETNSTLVEFWLSERDGGTVVRVAESGFAALALTDEERESAFEGNTGGWAGQCDLLRTRAERVVA